MKLNHVLVRTTDLDAMRRFWTDIIRLEPSHRPPFSIPGAWFSSNGQTIVHVVEDRGMTPGAGPIAHVALDGADYEELIATLKQHGVRYGENDVLLSNQRQLFIAGPDGLVVEMVFPLDTSTDPDHSRRGALT